MLGADAVVLQLHVQRVAPEDVLQASGPAAGLVVVAGQQGLLNHAAEAPGGGCQALGVVGEHLPVHPGLVVVALEEGPAGQLEQVAVAGVAVGQQGQVVVELPAALAVVAGVVHLGVLGPVAIGTLVTALERHVGLGADDRLDAVRLAGPVEVEDAVHVAVVGDAQRRLAVGCCRRDHLIDARRAVEQGVLGVGVQVHERRCHAALLLAGVSAGCLARGQIWHQPTLELPVCRT